MESSDQVSRTRNYTDFNVPMHVLPLEYVSTAAPVGALAGMRAEATGRLPQCDYDAEYEAVMSSTVMPQPLNRRTFSQFLNDATGRGTPLEPDFLNNTEIHVVCHSVPGLLESGFGAHYTRFNHSLELRAAFDGTEVFFLGAGAQEDVFIIGLTMAFNHRRPPELLPPEVMDDPEKRLKHPAQLFNFPRDLQQRNIKRNIEVGRAIASLAYAAAALGWEVRLLGQSFGYETLELLLGLTTEVDLERERAVAAVVVFPAPAVLDVSCLNVLHFKNKIVDIFNEGIQWRRGPYVLHEPIESSEEYAQTLASADTNDASEYVRLNRTYPAMFAEGFKYAHGTTVRRSLNSRFSATSEEYDENYTMGLMQFQQFVLRCWPDTGAENAESWSRCRCRCFPHVVLPWLQMVNVFFYVNRVEGIELGLYCLVRNKSYFEPAIDHGTGVPNGWQTNAISHRCPVPFYQNTPSHQWQFNASEDYGGNPSYYECFGKGAFLVAMVVPSKPNDPFMYARLLWEVGFLGDILAVEAQAQGLSAFAIETQNYPLWMNSLGIERNNGDIIFVYAVGKKKPCVQEKKKKLAERIAGSCCNWQKESRVLSKLFSFKWQIMRSASI